MAYNKFITQDGVVALDLTEDTITAETLEKGITAHDKHGVLIVGTMESGEVLEEYDGSVVIKNAVNLISFKVANTTYQAEDGMTWQQWVDSEYNTDGFIVGGGFIVSGRYTIVNNNYSASIKPTDVIIADYQYYQEY